MPHIDLRRYVAPHDHDFWMALLKKAPRLTEAAHERQARICRYALAGALLFTLPYVILDTWLDPASTWAMIAINGLSSLGFAIGLWAGALGAHRAARLWLIVTLEVQIAFLVFLTGQALNVVVFTVVAAALARVLFSADERGYQIVFVGFPLLTLLAGMTFAHTTYIDLTALSPALQAGARMANLLIAAVSVLLILGVFEREVLRSEEQLDGARERSDNLLHAVLPRKIADELRASTRMIADRHPEVTVLFADIAGFTPWAAQQDPETVVSMLERVFSRFDARVAAAGAEKIKTIGDAYMVISGAPDARHDHAHLIADLALQLLEDVRDVSTGTGMPLSLRVGIHTGEVIAGVIGAMRFSYDVWGDTVNTASRMESHGEPGRIQVSRETRDRLGGEFRFEKRGTIHIKGKGDMETWWLLGRA